MKKCLIGTNIAIFYMKGKFDLDVKFNNVPTDSRFISEMTLAELKFGVENSEKREKNRKARGLVKRVDADNKLRFDCQVHLFCLVDKLIYSTPTQW